jgi:hypothetical protein
MTAGLKPPPFSSDPDAVARAVVLSLAEHPNLNAHITGEQVWIAPAIDLGIGIDAEDGLVVGVLRNAGDLSLAELSATRRAISERVRAGRAGVQELQGSTFRSATWAASASTPSLRSSIRQRSRSWASGGSPTSRHPPRAVLPGASR